MNILMPSLEVIPHLSHLMGRASPQMSFLTAQREPCDWDDKAGISTANGATDLIATFWLTPFMGST